MSAESRVHHIEVPGAEELFTPDFLEFIVEACDRFKPAIEDIRQKREAMIERAIRDGALPTFSAGVGGQLRGLEGSRVAGRAH